MSKQFLKVALCAGLLVLGPAAADDAAVKKSAEAFLGVKVDGVRKTPYLGGLYELNVGGQLLYTDAKVAYIINGEILEVTTRKNVTEERVRQLSRIDFSDLPLDLAVKQVRGTGKRVFASFEDPNCGYCKRLAKDLQALTDVTIYTFLYPILSADSLEKSKAIWCAPDQAKAWNDWMISGVAPAKPSSCEHPTEQVVALGRKLRINGTPTIFFTDGDRVPGAVPVARIEQKLATTVK